MKAKALLFALLLVLTGTGIAHALQPDEMLADPKLEARAEHIGNELRCLVCQNESINESDASLAHDLRLLVRQRLLAGDTDQQVIGYLVSRYGDYVLLKPPFKAKTYILWFGPFVLLGFGVLGVVLFYRSRRQEAAAAPEFRPLSDEERQRLDVLLQDAPQQKDHSA